jgi:hypothetical protein
MNSESRLSAVESSADAMAFTPHAAAIHLWSLEQRVA